MREPPPHDPNADAPNDEFLGAFSFDCSRLLPADRRDRPVGRFHRQDELLPVEGASPVPAFVLSVYPPAGTDPKVVAHELRALFDAYFTEARKKGWQVSADTTPPSK
jgi:hypothetical protein